MPQAIVREIDDSKRYPCAIMFTDILGFTRLMRKDEELTIKKLESHRKQLELLHEHYDGRIIQYYGDGSLSVFEDPGQAIECAVAIQKAVLRLDLPLKIGLHHGDIVEKGAAVYGDGVNVASRIESVGVAQSILFSEDFWKAIRDKDYVAQSLGLLHFKHMNKPMRVYGLIGDGLQMPDKNHLEGKLAEQSGRRLKWILVATVFVFALAIGFLWRHNVQLSALLDDEITTVGVMPFRMDGLKLEDQSIQAGLFQNVVASLSSFYGLQVLSSRATERYADSQQKPRDIGKELGVSHLLYGTCGPGRDDSIRINLELVDVRNGRNVWAKSVSRPMEDLYGDPADVTADLAHFLEARVNPYRDVEEPATPKLSQEYFKLVSEAREEADKRTPDGLLAANNLLGQAIARDSAVGLGYALLSQNYSHLHEGGYLVKEEALEKAELNGGLALYHDRTLAEGYVANALMQYVFFQEESQDIRDLLQQAVMLRPSYDDAYYLIGKIHFDLFDLEMAENYFSLALKLSPDKSIYHYMLARTALAAGDKSKARDLAEMIDEQFSDDPRASSYLTHIYADIGDKEELEATLSRMPKGAQKTCDRLYARLQEGDLPSVEDEIEILRKAFPEINIDALLLQYYDAKGRRDEVWKIIDKAVAASSPWLKEINHFNLSVSSTDREKYTELMTTIKLTPVIE